MEPSMKDGNARAFLRILRRALAYDARAEEIANIWLRSRDFDAMTEAEVAWLAMHRRSELGRRALVRLQGRLEKAMYLRITDAG